MRVRCPHCDAKLRLDADDRDELIECPKCEETFKASPRDDDDDDVPAKKSKAKPKGKKKPFPIATAVVGVAVLGIVVGVIVYVTISRSDTKTEPKKDTAGAPGEPTPGNDPQGGVPPGGLKPNDAGGNRVPAEIAELFREPANLPTPVSRLVALAPAPLADPTLLALSAPTKFVPKNVADDGGKLTLEELKKASVYIKLTGPRWLSTGSGFLIRVEKKTGYIATNYHVVEAAVRVMEGAGGRASITAAFNSGEADEEQYGAEIVAYDSVADLAIIKVTGADSWPKPIDPRLALEPKETLPLLVCGFPLGDKLSTSGSSPAITINSRASVSSLRKDKRGKLERIQIDGTLNPGNSGGPVVDPDGRLVGIAVSIVSPQVGTGIGYAVPAADLNAMLDGRILYPQFAAAPVTDDEATLKPIVPVMDPFKKLKAVSLHLWTGDGKPPARIADPDTRFKLVAGAKKYDLPAPVRGEAKTEIPFAVHGSNRTVLLQTSLTSLDDTVQNSPPVPYQVKLTEVRTADDAIPLSQFVGEIAKHRGKVLALRATSDLGFSPRWHLHELSIRTEADAPVPTLQFLAEPELVAELPPTAVPMRGPVRLAVRVGSPGPDGRTPIRVIRMGLIEGQNRVILSFPSGEGEGESLAAINRNPDKFVGQTVTFEADMLPILNDGTTLQIFFVIPGNRPVNNLNFTTSREMAAQLKELNLRPTGLYHVRATAVVENRKNNAARIVSVQSLDFLDSEGRVLKTIE